MNELQSILKAAGELDRLNEPAILATVVRVEGSSYRRPGARMLATTAGRRIGSVSGGCLERDVIRQAWLRTADQAIIISYDSTAEDDGLWGLGLGCNGKIFILAERLTPGAAHEPLKFIRQKLSAGSACVVGTIFSAEGSFAARPGDKFIVDDSGNAFDPAHLIQQLNLQDEIDACQSLRRSEVRRIRRGEAEIDFLLEYIQPPPRILIVGAGFDAVPLASAAKSLGWFVTIADPRASHATPEHFPMADEYLVCPSDQIASRACPDDRTYIVMMTHRYPDDLAALPGLLLSSATYIGLLGPEHRKRRLLTDLATDGITIAPPLLEKLFAPIGLDIGADTPAEIAASILAEIIAFRAARQGGHLRDFDGPIHDRIPAIADANPYLCPTKSA